MHLPIHLCTNRAVRAVIVAPILQMRLNLVEYGFVVSDY